MENVIEIRDFLRTATQVAEITGMSIDKVLELTEKKELFSLSTLVGLTYPIGQFDTEGNVLSGADWVASQLDFKIAHPYLVAAWLNSPSPLFLELSPWEYLAENGVDARMGKIFPVFKTNQMRHLVQSS